LWPQEEVSLPYIEYFVPSVTPTQLAQHTVASAKPSNLLSDGSFLNETLASLITRTDALLTKILVAEMSLHQEVFAVLEDQAERGRSRVRHNPSSSVVSSAVEKSSDSSSSSGRRRSPNVSPSHSMDESPSRSQQSSPKSLVSPELAKAYAFVL
jgi:hypothetical protein